jgi:hypothetical protein
VRAGAYDSGRSLGHGAWGSLEQSGGKARADDHKTRQESSFFWGIFLLLLKLSLHESFEAHAPIMLMLKSTALRSVRGLRDRLFSEWHAEGYQGVRHSQCGCGAGGSSQAFLQSCPMALISIGGTREHGHGVRSWLCGDLPGEFEVDPLIERDMLLCGLQSQGAV